ncbi:MAG: rhodanese-like domain-containing protein [Myxococcales bacterium]|nr:rhodanese-like domain-containing protein [Myxococcales bacterium]
MSPISAAELLARIEAGNAPVILDVRSHSEFEHAHIPGALHVPFWAIAARASALPDSARQEIVVYCEHGPRAGLAKGALRLSGFPRVRYLAGHMAAWKRAGLPQEPGEARP